MTKESYPIRRKLAAAVAIAGVAATGAACTSSETAPTRTVTRTVTAPAHPKTAEKTTDAADQEKLTTAEVHFQTTAINVGKQIAEDATNPNSLCESYGGVSVGNKRQELARGLEHTAGFPEMFMTYDQAQRQVTMRSITAENPRAPLSKQKFDEVSMVFQSTDPDLNNLDRKIAASEPLVAQDYMAFLDGNVSARQVNTLHGLADPSYVYLTLNKTEGVYQYKAAGVSDAVDIGTHNSDILDTMSRDLEATELKLRQGI